jgi:hypothetical protein
MARAERICEYCLIHEDDTYFGCQVDHVISEKHGGPTSEDNLALACTFCNRYKGSDIGSIIWTTNTFVRFYNPRTDNWAEHFELDGIIIKPRTAIGEVTARILEFNNAERLLERETLQAVGRYPTPEAAARIQA